MTTRIHQTFERLKQDGKQALIPFLTAGYPTMELSRQLLCALPKYGADLVECGIPFSDPAADGKEIRRAGKTALELGFRLQSIFDLVALFRRANPETPLILMGYYNPIFHYGVKEFANDILQAGADGLILVDLPPEEGEEVLSVLPEELCLIRLITPTTDAQRLKIICAQARGFLYYVTITGITGTTAAQPSQVQKHLRALQPPLPIVAGFGIKTIGQIRQFAAIPELAGVVVGSALIKTLRMHAAGPKREVHAILKAKLAAYAKGLNSHRKERINAFHGN